MLYKVISIPPSVHMMQSVEALFRNLVAKFLINTIHDDKISWANRHAWMATF